MEQKPSFLEKLIFCSRTPSRLNPDLAQERLHVFGLTRLGLDTQIAENEIIVKSIYRRAFPEREHCRMIGRHWQDLGFQHTDPRTDVRGAGMLGLLHLIHLQEYPQLFKYILELSLD